jgi:mercuric ion transport protein
MGGRGILTIGAIGTVIAAICCFTPALVLLLGLARLGAVLGWIDLLPLLALFIAVALYGWHRQRVEKIGETD